MTMGQVSCHSSTSIDKHARTSGYKSDMSCTKKQSCQSRFGERRLHFWQLVLKRVVRRRLASGPATRRDEQTPPRLTGPLR
jgi:hypothetical protein